MNQFYNNVKTVVLLGLMTALILAFGSCFGSNGLIIALIIAAGMNISGYFFSDKIAIASVRGVEVGPEHPLYQIVEKLVQRAGLPMPRVYVSPLGAPNAFATGRNPHHAAVCATQGLLDILDRDEIAGVMGHELAHVKHRDILIVSVAATIAAAISYLGYMFMWGMGSRGRRGGNVLEMLALMILGPIAAGLIQCAISRSREFNADTEGAGIAGDPMALATALEKLHIAAERVPMDVNPAMNSMFITEPRNLVRSIGNLFQTHPPLEARLKNLIGRETTGRFHYAA
jgi:heat shock protein HtpX